ncbi:cytochrome P450 [Myxococcota bacterium]|nr:cytochrome P450 [Myxococcota bacterium]
MRAPLYSASPDEIFEQRTIDDPSSFYSRLRRSTPIARIAETGAHLVTSWALVDEALSREEDFSANLTGLLIRDANGQPAMMSMADTGATQVISTADEPDHTVHRDLLQRRLTPARITAMESLIQGWADYAVTPLVAAGGGDFVAVTEGVPALVLANLLGLPESDIAYFRTWSMMGGDMLAGDVEADRMRFLFAENERMNAYLSTHLDRADAAIAEEPDATLLAILARGIADGLIDRKTALGIATILFGAGGESTASLIGSCLFRLARDPALADSLRADPSLVARFVEEVVRLEPPFNFHYRSVRRASRLGGFDLEAGDKVLLVWSAANRDEAVFEDPDGLRLDRRHPKNHMGFGRGRHFCLGAHLARLEARCIVESLLRQTRRIGLDPAKPAVWARSIFVRRLERIPLAVVA